MFEIRHHASLGSTNDEAKRLAESGCAHGVVVHADQQTSGHGRFGRPWHSPLGNLLFSVVLRPNVPVTRAAELGFVAAVVTADCVAELLGSGAGVGLKWPNDLQIDGGKAAGILPEARTVDGLLSWSVLGVGLNLAHAPDGMPYPVTCLSAHGAAVTPSRALETFLAHLGGWLRRWERDGFSAVRTAWLGYANGLGTELTVNLGARRETGIFRDLDADGAMLLATPNGPRRITAGEVAFGAP